MKPKRKPICKECSEFLNPDDISRDRCDECNWYVKFSVWIYVEKAYEREMANSMEDYYQDIREPEKLAARDTLEEVNYFLEGLV